MTRRKFHWKVPLQSRGGQTLERDVHTFWDPKATGASEAVATAARIEAGRALNSECVVVGDPVLVSEEVAAA